VSRASRAPASPPAASVLYGAFLFTTGLSALLLFLVQPLIGKAILPWFGGGPGVWTSAMLFFQLVLLAGYAYAHGLSARLTPRGQIVVHALVLLAALACLPIYLDPAWKPSAGDDPVARISGLLAVSVGLPYFALSTTGPLLQRWFGGLFPQRTPYRLYALSNAGSLGALLLYPTVFEPLLGVPVQALVWSVLFGAFALGVALCAAAWLRSGGGVVADSGANSDALVPGTAVLTWRTRALWFLLSLLPSWMLLAVTNQLCLDVASVPFLWVAPLAVYLISFIACFGHVALYNRMAFVTVWLLASVALCAQLIDPTQGGLVRQTCVFLSVLLGCSMLCHGELSRRRPALEHLTAFYLQVSLGGAAGGVLVGVIAPRVFVDYYELHLGVVACYVLLLAIFIGERRRPGVRLPMLLTSLGLGATTLGLAAAIALAQGGDQLSGRTLEQARNFYGVLRAAEVSGGRVLTHGHIWHGMQRTEPGRRRDTSLYYAATSGVAQVLRDRGSRGPQRVGVIGLGIGMLAAYGERGDVYRFYEIDPNVTRMARTYFTFLSDSAADIEIVEGDARLSLEHEPPQGFDVLAVDAFSSDAIPVHLLTTEAFAGYRRHLRADGVLAVHVSNRHVDLLPVVYGAANALGWSMRVARVEADFKRLVSATTWALLSPSATRLSAVGNIEIPSRTLVWTDARSSLFEVVR